jgi:colicin import membrane protein
MTGLSILCHLLFFSGVLFLPQLGFDRHYIPTTVEVDLVSLPGAGSQVPADSGRAPLPASPETEPVQPKEASVQPEQPKETPVQPVQVKHEKAAEETVSVAPKAPEVKKSLKKKTYDASKAIKSAIAKMEKEAPESRPRSVVEAIGKLKEEVEAQPGLAMRGGASAGGAGRKSLDLLDIYNAEIWHTIQKNWAFSEEMVHGRVDLEATIIVKIMREGEIRDIWFEKRSGNNYFDDSVFKAVKKSDPLPPLPEGFRGRFYEVGLRFNLSELQRNF